MSYYHINRTMCNTLDEMRMCLKTRNFSYLGSLIEECQVMGNRMEASLYDKHDIESLHAEKKKLKAEVKKLEQRVEGLKDVCGDTGK